MATWADLDDEYEKMRKNIIQTLEKKGTYRLDKKTRALWNEFIKTKAAEDLFISTIDDDEGLTYFYGKIGDRKEVSKQEMEAILDEFWEEKKKAFENPNTPKNIKIYDVFINYMKNQAKAPAKNKTKKNQTAKNKSTTKK